MVWKVCIWFNISSWSCSHRAVLLKQMALLSCSLKEFSDKMNFSEWLGHIPSTCDPHFSRDLPHILVCYASPLSRQYFLLFSDAPSIHTKSLSSLCCLDERKCPWILPSALNIASSWKNQHIPEFASRSTSHPVSLIVWLVKSLHHSDPQFSCKMGIKQLKGIKWGNICKIIHI